MKQRSESQQILTYLAEFIKRGKDGDLASATQIWKSDHHAFELWGFAVSVYKPGIPRLLVVRNGGTESIERAVRRTRNHERFPSFEFGTSTDQRIQFDFIFSEPTPVEFSRLSDLSLPDCKVVDDAPTRFELGVHGLRIKSSDDVRYFLPGDAFVHSVLGLNQLRQRIAQISGEEDFDKMSFSMFTSKSYVNTSEGWSYLYRGYPTTLDSGAITTEPYSDRQIFDRIDEGVRWLSRNCDSEGRFLYYYEAKSGTLRNHEHPDRDPDLNPYYNLLRHCGAVITLGLYLETHPHDEDPALHESCKNALHSATEFFLKQLVVEENHIAEKAFPIFNGKAKLGGAGLGLYMLSRAKSVLPNSDVLSPATAIARHIVGEIQESGEFLYYHTYLKEAITAENNREHFSFYYPGEALVGIAGFLIHFPEANLLDESVCKQIHLALRFLINERPQQHRDHFQSLPSDSWLMMAINDLWDIEAFRHPDYAEFVFSDADQMIEHQYTAENALYPDYVGSFFYRYGDHPYPDGARAEGLVAAYHLALKLNDTQRALRYHRAIVAVTWACLRLCNTKDSTYSCHDPELSRGGIRFKFTRQWFRIDTIQHVACFLYRNYSIHRMLLDPGEELRSMVRLAIMNSPAKPLSIHPGWRYAEAYLFRFTIQSEGTREIWVSCQEIAAAISIATNRLGLSESSKIDLLSLTSVLDLVFYSLNEFLGLSPGDMDEPRGICLDCKSDRNRRKYILNEDIKTAGQSIDNMISAYCQLNELSESLAHSELRIGLFRAIRYPAVRI